MVDPNPNQDNGVLASLSPETLDRLADLVVAPLDYYLHNSKFINMFQANTTGGYKIFVYYCP